ncbi:MAG: hypothetical protein J3K34DRAFT_402718 [Monoraphidium minutum]|nr:MAG: hypothetical protein J3K34DRAFT_402718 [Monoraphidium minutum]
MARCTRLLLPSLRACSSVAFAARELSQRSRARPPARAPLPEALIRGPRFAAHVHGLAPSPPALTLHTSRRPAAPASGPACGPFAPSTPVLYV